MMGGPERNAPLGNTRGSMYGDMDPDNSMPRGRFDNDMGDRPPWQQNEKPKDDQFRGMNKDLPRDDSNWESMSWPPGDSLKNTVKQDNKGNSGFNRDSADRADQSWNKDGMANRSGFPPNRFDSSDKSADGIKRGRFQGEPENMQTPYSQYEPPAAQAGYGQWNDKNQRSEPDRNPRGDGFDQHYGGNHPNNQWGDKQNDNQWRSDSRGPSEPKSEKRWGQQPDQYGNNTNNWPSNQNQFPANNRDAPVNKWNQPDNRLEYEQDNKPFADRQQWNQSGETWNQGSQWTQDNSNKWDSTVPTSKWDDQSRWNNSGDAGWNQENKINDSRWSNPNDQAKGFAPGANRWEDPSQQSWSAVQQNKWHADQASNQWKPEQEKNQWGYASNAQPPGPPDGNFNPYVPPPDNDAVRSAADFVKLSAAAPPPPPADTTPAYSHDSGYKAPNSALSEDPQKAWWQQPPPQYSNSEMISTSESIEAAPVTDMNKEEPKQVQSEGWHWITGKGWVWGFGEKDDSANTGYSAETQEVAEDPNKWSQDYQWNAYTQSINSTSSVAEDDLSQKKSRWGDGTNATVEGTADSEANKTETPADWTSQAAPMYSYADPHAAYPQAYPPYGQNPPFPPYGAPGIPPPGLDPNFQAPPPVAAFVPPPMGVPPPGMPRFGMPYGAPRPF